MPGFQLFSADPDASLRPTKLALKLTIISKLKPASIISMIAAWAQRRQLLTLQQWYSLFENREAQLIHSRSFSPLSSREKDLSRRIAISKVQVHHWAQIFLSLCLLPWWYSKLSFNIGNLLVFRQVWIYHKPPLLWVASSYDFKESCSNGQEDINARALESIVICVICCPMLKAA